MQNYHVTGNNDTSADNSQTYFFLGGKQTITIVPSDTHQYKDELPTMETISEVLYDADICLSKHHRLVVFNSFIVHRLVARSAYPEVHTKHYLASENTS